MYRLTTAAALFWAATLYSNIDSELHAGETGRENVKVQHNRDSFVSQVTIDAKNGRVAWADVVRGVARVRGYDDQALDQTLRLSTVDHWKMKIDGRAATVALYSASRMLGDDVKLGVVRNAKAEPQLVIQLDHEAILASQRHIKQQLRDTLLPQSYNGHKYGIRVDEKSLAATDDDQLVIFIHGLNSHPHTARRLSAMAQDNGLACAFFDYPNDQAIDISGRLLSEELKRWKKLHPRQRVSLVTHSMGGLVARTAIEDPKLDPGNVDRLIMVAPPNQGCELAQFAFGLDLWEYKDVGVIEDGKCLFYSSIEDGLSEATVDLEPGSIFLTKLNRRERNANVKYSIFLGTGGPCTRDELDKVRSHIRKIGGYCSWAAFFGSRLDPAIGDLDEVVNGHGDGVVAVKRGRLDGVKDTNVMKFGHMKVLHDTNDPEVRKVYDAVLKRLKAS